VLEEEVTAANDGLTVAELREKGRVLSVVPTGTDRKNRRPEPVSGSTASGRSATTASSSSRSSSSSSASSSSSSSSTRVTLGEMS
jgi:hypothetical protein